MLEQNDYAPLSTSDVSDAFSTDMSDDEEMAPRPTGAHRRRSTSKPRHSLSVEVAKNKQNGHARSVAASSSSTGRGRTSSLLKDVPGAAPAPSPHSAAYAHEQAQVYREALQRRGLHGVRKNIEAIRHIAPHFEPYHVHLLCTASLTVSYQVLQVFVPVLLATAAECFTGEPPNWVQSIVGERSNVAYFLSGSVVALFCMLAILEWLYEWLFASIALGVRHGLRMQVFETAMMVPSRDIALLLDVNETVNKGPLGLATTEGELDGVSLPRAGSGGKRASFGPAVEGVVSPVTVVVDVEGGAPPMENGHADSSGAGAPESESAEGVVLSGSGRDSLVDTVELEVHSGPPVSPSPGFVRRVQSRVSTGSSSTMSSYTSSHLPADSHRVPQPQAGGSSGSNDGNDMIVHIMKDCNRVEGWLRMLVVDIPQAIGLSLMAVFFLLAISWRLAVIALWPFPLVVCVALFQAKRLNDSEAAASRAESRLFSRLSNMVHHMTTVNASNAEAYEYNRLGRSSRRYRDATMTYCHLSSVLSPVVRMLVLAGIAASLLLGSHWLLTSAGSEQGAKDSITMGKLMFVLLLMTMILWPARNAGNKLQMQLKSIASMRRVLVLLDLGPRLALPRPAAPLDLMVVHPSLQFKDVHLTHVVGVRLKEDEDEDDAIVSRVRAQRGAGVEREVEGSSGFEVDHEHEGIVIERCSVLRGFALEMEPQSTVAVFAPPGCGKSSIVDVLLRRCEMDRGEVLFNGHDIGTLSPLDLRSNIAHLAQDTHIIRGTLWDNVNYGRLLHGLTEEEREQRVIEASMRAQLHVLVQQLPDGYDTMLEEGDDFALLGGLKRRIGLARCLLRRAPMMLMDNPTSGCDGATRRMLCRHLLSIIGDTTTLVLSDDLALVRHFPRIVVLHEGRVVEDGAHADLLQNDYIYAAMWGDYTGAK